MTDSPAVILYDQNGNPVALREGTFIDGYQPVLLMAGRDENGNVKIFETVDGALTVNVTNPVTVDGYLSVEEPVEVTGSVAIDGTVTVDGYVGIEGAVEVTGLDGDPIEVSLVDGYVNVDGPIEVTGIGGDPVEITGEVSLKDGYVNIDGPIEVIPTPARTVEGRYFATTGIINGSNSSQLLMTLENPAGSGVTMYLTFVDVNGLASVGNYPNPFLYRVSRMIGLPTGGTVLAEEQRSTSEGPSLGIARQTPTGTGSAGNFWVDTAGSIRNSRPNRPKSQRAFETDVEDKEIIIQEGEAIGVFANANANQWRHFVSIRWNEVAI